MVSYRDAVATVETERLLLRPWRHDDLDQLATVFAEPAVWTYPFGRGLSREETERFLDRQFQHWEQHGFGLWTAEVKDGGAPIGFIGLAVPD